MNLKKIEYKKLKKKVDEKGYFIIKYFLEPKLVSKILSLLRKEFNSKKDIRKSGEYFSGMSDFQRLDIGEYPASSRFSRYFFKFPWNKNDAFSQIASDAYDVRSNLTNYQIGLWNGIKKTSSLKKQTKLL